MDGDPSPHAEDFAEMAISLHEVGSYAETLGRVLEFAVKTLGCSFAGLVVLREQGRIETIASTHPLVAELDRIQVQYGEGPDLELVEDRPHVLIPDVRQEDRWPRWAAEVTANGVRSMLGVRMRTSSSVIGSLNFFDVEADQFGTDELDVANVLARHAAVALDNARENEHLWKAIDARNLIGQAQGVLMERFDVDADQAFEVLRRYSQDGNLKLQDVARRLVDTRELPS